MKTIRYFFFSMLMFNSLLMIRCTSPSQSNPQATQQELETFMATYANLLRVRDMEGIANLYVDSAIVMSGHGLHQVLSHDSVRAHYLRSSRKPVDFRWDNLRIEPMGTEAVFVTGVFYWNETPPASYTGVFVRTSKGWKIKHEHESFSCD